MKCDEYRALISAAADVPLPPEEETSLQQHLAECEECRRYAESLEALRTELQQPMEPPEALRKRVMERVRQEARAKKLRSFRRYGSLAACLLLIVSLGLFRKLSTPKAAETPMSAKAASGATADMAPAMAEEACVTEECAEAPAEAEAPMNMMMSNSWTPDPESLARDFLWERDGREYGECRVEESDILPEYRAILEDYEPVEPYTLVEFEEITVLVDANTVVFGTIE